MRKPASCVISIALSLVMSVGLIPSPAFATISDAAESTAQPSDSPDLDSETSATTDNQQTGLSDESEQGAISLDTTAKNRNQLSSQIPSEASSINDSPTNANHQNNPSTTSTETPLVDWHRYESCKWMISTDGTLVMRTIDEGDSTLEYCSWKEHAALIRKADLAGLDASDITGMSYMFSGCTNLTSVDLSGLDMSSVLNMSYMFSGCQNLASINFTGLDVSSVTNMSDMLYGCSGLSSVDLTGLNTSRVTNMSDMLSGCSSLTSVDLTGVDTSSVTDMSYMFYDCDNLTYLDLSELNISNVSSMKSMFDNCDRLLSVGLSGLSPSNVTDMSGMFSGCFSLTTMDLSGLDTSSVADMSGMFNNCYELTSLNLSGIDTSKVVSMERMFDNCNNLASLSLSKLDTSKVKNMERMFVNCDALTSLDLSGLNTSKVTSMREMFSSCRNLTDLNLSRIDTSNVVNMREMFSGCANLASLNLSMLDTSNVVNMNSMFGSCSSLKEVDISSFDTTKCSVNPNALPKLFDGCNSLERIAVGAKCAILFPNPGGKTTGNWINAASGTVYAPNAIPTKTEAVYEAQLDISKFAFTCDLSNVVYTGSPIEKDVSSALEQGRDYAVAYKDNVAAGTATIEITGKGRYANTVEYHYNILKADPDYPEVEEVTAICGQKLSDISLPEGFTWEYDESTTVDMPGWQSYSATYTPTDTANYNTVSGIPITVHATQPIDASMFFVDDTDIQYTGSPLTPSVTSYTVPDDQYSVTYENNVNVGQATAIITANNEYYSGTCTIPFEIKPIPAPPTYQHSTTAQSGDIMLTVQWNDPQLGQKTTFHVSATGGSGAYRFRMDAPTYMDPDGSNESVADPSRNQWLQYTGECASRDYQFEMTASGTYYLRFYLMDKTAGVYYLRANVFASANDDAYPAVSTIVKSAVDKCNAETDGSDYARALWLHDWTLDQLEYDHDLNWCSAESGLTRHQGTCESYQRIYAKLLDAAGIANGRITGNGHTWNAVKIDGKWCQMDLTWDDTNDNWYGDLDQRHLYFGLTDELMAIAHSDHTANYQAEGYSYRSTDLSNNYFVRNGKADEWAEAYANRIQQHLDARETEFSIDADNQSFPPSISGIENSIIAYAINQREWKTANAKAGIIATSSVTTESSSKWSAKYSFVASYTDSSPSHERILPDGFYSIYSSLDQTKALDVRMESRDDGANVQLWQDHGGLQQKVYLQFQDDGTYLITFAHSGKALAAESLRDGANVSQASINSNSDLQKWTIEPSGVGYTLKTKAGNQWLNVRLGNPKNGANIQTWSNGGVMETVFSIVPTETNALPNGKYSIKTGLDTTKAIDIRLASQDDFANAQIWTDYKSSNQMVELRRQADNTYAIFFTHSNKALTAESLRDGANVCQARYTGSSLQHWKLEKNGLGYTLKVAAGNEYLNVRLANSNNGANIQTWSNGGVKETIFVFEPR